MDDASPEIKAIQQEMWMRLPMEERFRRAAEMNALARAFIERRAPEGATEDERRRFIFREMYGFELPDADEP
jgi:hypothetical protein